MRPRTFFPANDRLVSISRHCRSPYVYGVVWVISVPLCSKPVQAMTDLASSSISGTRLGIGTARTINPLPVPVSAQTSAEGSCEAADLIFAQPIPETSMSYPNAFDLYLVRISVGGL